MIYEVFCVFDKCAGTYGTPIFAQNEGMAKRDFLHFCEDPKVSFFASDLQLYKLGSFDSVSGELSVLPKPEFLTSGLPEVADNVEA